jgi:DUF4097 and DUF4098 domain-containing protein YvlB
MPLPTRFPRTLVLVALAFGAALPAAAQHKNKSKSRDRDEEGNAKIDTTITVSRGVTIDLAITSGTIKVTSWDKPQVQIHATSESGDLRFDFSQSRVSLSGEEQNGGEDANLEVIVPAGARVTATSIDGDIEIRGVSEVEANTISGSLTASNIAGRATLTSVSGDLVANDLGGPVKANDVNGDVALSDISGDVSVETVSGEMKLRGVKSSYVRTSTVSGDVQFEGALDPKGRYEFHSHSGEIIMTLPKGTGAQITLRGYNGELRSSCQMMLLPGDGPGGHNRSQTFVIGNGGAKVSFDTFSGDVEIRGACSGNPKAKEE